MELLERIKNYFFRSVIEQRSEGVKPVHSITNFEQANTFGLLYDSSLEGADGMVSKIAETLRAKDKQVTVFAFLNDKKIDRKEGTGIFNANDINWYGVPTADKALQFSDQRFDVLLAPITVPNRPLEYLAYFSKAKCRVGVYQTDKTNAYELMVNVNETSSIQQILEQMIQLLNQIKL